GDRVLAVLAHRELVVVVRKTADRGLDRAARLIGSALADGMVDLADLSGAEGVLQRGVGAFGAGDDHQPAGAHVQAADDPLSLRVTGGADADARGGEVPEHGGPGPSGAGMRGDADGLVEHDDVVVLVDQAHARGDLRTHLDRGLLLGQLDMHHHPGLEPGGAGRRRTVDEHVACRDEVRGAGAGQAQHPRDAHVDPFAGEAVGDHQRARRAHLCSSGVLLPSAAALASCWAAGSAATPNSPRATIRIAPPTTPMSATLKTGQFGSSRKSTTAPWKGDGSRSRRSWMLPSAPPRMSPSARV